MAVWMDGFQEKVVHIVAWQSWSVDCDETFTFVLSSYNNTGKSCSSHTEGEKQRECKGEKEGKGRKGRVKGRGDRESNTPN